MHFICLTPTYGRPSLVANALMLFLDQDLPAGDTAHMAILDDARQIRPQSDRQGPLSWEIFNALAWIPLPRMTPRCWPRWAESRAIRRQSTSSGTTTTCIRRGTWRRSAPRSGRRRRGGTRRWCGVPTASIRPSRCRGKSRPPAASTGRLAIWAPLLQNLGGWPEHGAGDV